MGKIDDALKKSAEEKGSGNFAGNSSTRHETHGDTDGTAEKLTDMDKHRDYEPGSYKESRLDPNLVTWFQPQSMEAEQFRILKTSILFPEKGFPPKTIMITSAEPNEGKSLIASNLAISIAQSMENHVLLIDCDIRTPTIHKMFGYDKLTGLREYLEHKKTIPEILFPSITKKLKIIPGGTPHPVPTELLSSSKMENLMLETKTRYKDRYIIIDTPPPRLTAETSALSKYVDGIIIVVKHGKTPRKAVKNLMDSLNREKIMGIVSNGFHQDMGFGYGRYKYQKQSYRYAQ